MHRKNVKEGVNTNKDEGITRLFSVNCNGLGSGSKDEKFQLLRERVRVETLMEL